MRVLRWLLVLFLSVAMDAAPPLVPSVIEAYEGMEEEVQPGRHRRGLRRAATPDGARATQETPARMIRRPPSGNPAPTAPTASAGRVRKLPPSTSDSASAPEDQ
jgi:hypothetical protein